MEEKDSRKLAELDARVDKIDSRLTRVETEMKDSRDENRRGFDDIKAQFANLYAERTEWGKFAREQLGKVIRFLMWLIPALVGLRYAAEKIFSN